MTIRLKIIIFVLTGLMLVFLPIFVDGLFWIGSYVALTNSFEPHQILSYIGAVLPIVPAVILGWAVWRQNQKLHDMNAKLQKQNLRISQDAVKNASYNFLSLKNVAISAKDLGWSDTTKFQQNAIELRYNRSDRCNGSKYALWLNFEGEAHDKAPICKIEIKNLMLSFEVVGINVDERLAAWPFSKTYSTSATKISNDENKYVFKLECYIPQYFSNGILTGSSFTNLKISMCVSYVNALNVRVQVTHTLELHRNQPSAETWSISNEKTEFGEIDVKESESMSKLTSIDQTAKIPDDVATPEDLKAIAIAEQELADGEAIDFDDID